MSEEHRPASNDDASPHEPLVESPGLISPAAGNSVPSYDDEDDALFGEQVERVEKLFQEGTLLAVDAADMLGLSLEEFVEEFIVNDDAIDLGLEDDADRRRFIREFAAVLQTERTGRSVRDFVADFIVEERIPERPFEWYASPELERFSVEPLGFALRRAVARGDSVADFVATTLLPDAFLNHLGVVLTSIPAMRTRALESLESCEEYAMNDRWFSALSPAASACAVSELAELECALDARQIGRAAQILAFVDCRPMLARPSDADALRLLFCYTKWIQMDASYLPRVEDALAAFRGVPKRTLTDVDVVRVDLIEAIVRFYRERYDEARHFLDIVVSNARKLVQPSELLFWCIYFEAKTEWKRRKYDNARALIEEGYAAAAPLHAAQRAMLALLDAWLCFLSGEFAKSRALLDQVWPVFERSDDWLTRGDILSFKGRLARQEEDYRGALEYFRQSIESYAVRDSKHRNVGRAHVNISVCLLHCVLQSQRDGAALIACERLVEAREHLDAAEFIYTGPAPSLRGLGKVHVTYALLFLAVGEQDRAYRAGQRAFNEGRQVADNFIMADARRIQALSASDSIQAAALAEEAFRFADKTDNRRLKAKILLSLAEVKEQFPFHDANAANQLRSAADRLLSHEQRKDFHVIRPSFLAAD